MEKSKLQIDCKNDLTISGTLLAKQEDTITYTSKKTNLQVEAKRDILVLQTSFGIVLCRCFSQDPKDKELVGVLNSGDPLVLPVVSYNIENGLKSASVRLH